MLRRCVSPYAVTETNRTQGAGVFVFPGDQGDKRPGRIARRAGEIARHGAMRDVTARRYENSHGTQHTTRHDDDTTRYGHGHDDAIAARRGGRGRGAAREDGNAYG